MHSGQQQRLIRNRRRRNNCFKAGARSAHGHKRASAPSDIYRTFFVESSSVFFVPPHRGPIKNGRRLSGREGRHRSAEPERARFAFVPGNGSDVTRVYWKCLFAPAVHRDLSYSMNDSLIHLLYERLVDLSIVTA